MRERDKELNERGESADLLAKSRMKNQQIENGQSKIVTVSKVQKDAGIRFVRLPRSKTVSIVSHFIQFHVEFNVFKLHYGRNLREYKDARDFVFSTQIWEKITKNREGIFCKSVMRWQYLRVNKVVNKVKNEKIKFITSHAA